MDTSPFQMRSSFSGSSSLDAQGLYPIRRASEFDIGLPPRYSTLTGALPGLTDDNGVTFRPPAYSRVVQQRSQSVARCGHGGQNIFQTSTHSHARDGIHQHEYHIMNGNRAKPWATLKVYSGSSSDGLNTPHYMEGDIIRGSFELNLDPPQNISSISLSLRGRINASVYENGSYTFLDQPITSWDRNDGDPRSMFFTPETTIKKFEGKLSGEYTWPFMLTFPKEVTIRGQHQYLSKEYPTPRTFVEDGTNTSVEYELALRVTHGMLRTDSKLKVEIVYIPDIIGPDPFSSLGKEVYFENGKLPGPDEDPDCWFTLPHANIHGKLTFNERHAHLRCTLSIAQPQCYPHGSVIPCHLSIHSANTEALNTLANHNSVRVCLIRRIQYYQDPKQVYSRTLNVNKDQVQPGVLEQVETIERAVWWAGSSEEPDTRALEGEIHLNKDLQPSSQFLLFKVSYTIEFYPFESTAFKCTNSGFANTERKPKAFISHPITITTQYQEGQVPFPVTKLRPPPGKRIEFPPPEFSFCPF